MPRRYPVESYSPDEFDDFLISEHDAYKRRHREETAEEVKKRHERDSYFDGDHDYNEQR